MNALTFAEMSGVGKNRVLRYLSAWNLAAEQGIVPAANTHGTNQHAPHTWRLWHKVH